MRSVIKLITQGLANSAGCLTLLKLTAAMCHRVTDRSKHWHDSQTLVIVSIICAGACQFVSAATYFACNVAVDWLAITLKLCVIIPY